MNGSVHEFYHLKARITLEQVITSVFEKRTILMSRTSRFTGKLGSRIGDRGSEIEDRFKQIEIK